ncbi:MAG: phenylacetate--CoA ligase family protein [Acidobacteria bacterium]|nr:phenylacetate--CoA ligase family protein [Acidobacteriota bacterium]
MSARRLLHGAYLRARQGKVLALLAGMERDEWLSRDELQARQRARLREILVHAAAHVPFYREILAGAGVNPGTEEPAELLARLPVVTKEMLRERGEAFRSDDGVPRGATVNSTGGSTGQPLTFYQDDLYRLHRQAVMYRGFRWCGWRVGGPLAYLWGSDVDSRSHRGAGALRDAALGVTWVDAFTLDDLAIDRVLDRIGAARPDILIGYASSIRHLARRALARGGGPRLRAIETSAELLTPDARETIERAFGSRVFDRYGCREAGVVSHECGAGDGWHINTETVWLETDAEGRLLLSTLMNYSMPLLRYRNEDLVELGRTGCRCGRGLPLMTRVVGRRADIILSPSGRAIHGEFFTHLFYGVPGVVEFQVVQKTREDLVIRVVAGESFDEAARGRIERTILQHGDAAFRIRWEMPREIPRGRSGKHRFTISEIDA